MRFLCLHGQGTNSEIMKLQTRTLRNRLPSSYEYEFIDGEEDSEPPSGLDLIYPGPYLQYASCAESVDRAIEYLEEIISEEGPFDGVIGFSQGAAVAARLILRYQKRDPLGPQPFKMALFLCAASLFYATDMQEYQQKMKGVAGITISIPTVHVIGASDPHRPFSLDLTRLCEKKICGVVEHTMGHEIPKDAVVTEETRKAVESAVRLSRMGF